MPNFYYLFLKCTLRNAYIFLQNLLYADFRNESNFSANVNRLIYSIIPSDTISNIESVVRKSLKIELESYKLIPNSQAALLLLDEVFEVNSPAKKRIEEIITNHATRKWTLTNDNNPSTNDLITIDFEKIINDRAYVRTEEYWYLKWFDLNIQDYIYEYNNTNSQIYILDRVGNDYKNWKIETNFYPAVNEGRNIIPKLPRKDIERISKVELKQYELKARISELVSQNGLQKALEELKFFSINEDIQNQVSILNAQFLEAVKNKNLNIITYDEYTRAISKISYHILNIL